MKEISQGGGAGLEKERNRRVSETGVLPVSSVTDEFNHFEVDLAGFAAGSWWRTQTL